MTGFSAECAHSMAPFEPASPASRQHIYSGGHRWQSALSLWLSAGTWSRKMYSSSRGAVCTALLSALSMLCLPAEEMCPCVQDDTASLWLARWEGAGQRLSCICNFWQVQHILMDDNERVSSLGKEYDHLTKHTSADAHLLCISAACRYSQGGGPDLAFTLVCWLPT